MPGPDFSRVSASYDAASYTTGDPITVTLSGKAAAAATISVTSTVTTPNGDEYALDFPLPSLTRLDPVKLKTVTDSDGRVWTISADGLTATAVA